MSIRISKCCTQIASKCEYGVQFNDYTPLEMPMNMQIYHTSSLALLPADITVL